MGLTEIFPIVIFIGISLVVSGLIHYFFMFVEGEKYPSHEKETKKEKIDNKPALMEEPLLTYKEYKKYLKDLIGHKKLEHYPEDLLIQKYNCFVTSEFVKDMGEDRIKDNLRKCYFSDVRDKRKKKRE